MILLIPVKKSHIQFIRTNATQSWGIQGSDVVVATGTGSGKTESFLFPMLTHLADDARRTKEEGGEEASSERALRCLILYPMNALVADQVSRLRSLLGNPKMALRLMRMGMGRFPQFGMYTGRSEYHGWYATETASGWKRNSKMGRINTYLNSLKELQERPDAWTALTSKHKLPSMGGRLIQADSNASPFDTLSFDELSPRAKMDLLDKAKGRSAKDAVRSARYELVANQERFDRFMASDRYDAIHGLHLSRLGDGLDRELIGRHRHLGAFTGTSSTSTHTLMPKMSSKLGVGIPDVMVTNYSMLEYMLMRPLEHIFWHSTGEWLRDCTRDSSDPLRRKLMLVVDEAHLYRGALGTEFSLLLNRLLNVLNVERDRLQFIITSASLGNDEQSKRKYVGGLLSLAKGGEREQGLVLPPTRLAPVVVPQKARSFINAEEAGKLHDIKKRRPEHITGEQRILMEQEALDVLFGADKRRLAEQNHLHIDDMVARHQQVAYDLLSTSAVFLRMKQLLLRPNDATLEDREALMGEYARRGINTDESVTMLRRIPRRASILRALLVEATTGKEQADAALDALLDLAASACTQQQKSGFGNVHPRFSRSDLLFVRRRHRPNLPGCARFIPRAPATAMMLNARARGGGVFTTSSPTGIVEGLLHSFGLRGGQKITPTTERQPQWKMGHIPVHSSIENSLMGGSETAFSAT